MPVDPKQLRLASNENPEPVAPEVRAAIEAGAQFVNRYTFEPEARVLARVARYYDCPLANLTLVRGIDEAIDRLIDEFPSMRYASVWPGFDAYIGRFQLRDNPYLSIGLREDFALDPGDLDQLTNDDFVFLADPANPTGRPLSTDEHEVIAARAGKVFIDETYFDYAGMAERPAFGGDRFVFRSFSKSFGLAGARLGVVFGEAEIIARIKRRQWYCNVGVLDLCALEAALGRDELRKRHVDAIVRERERMREALIRLGLRVHPSGGNFILVQNKNGQSIHSFLRERDIAVQNTERFGLGDHARISVGLPADNDELIAAMSAYVQVQERSHVG